MNFTVLGTGSYLPPRVVTNDELSTFLDTSDEWISQRVGIRSRHVATTETAADMALRAAEAALENSGIAAGEIDLILTASISGETVSPSVSCLVQRGLGVSCPAFDLSAACSAFLFLLDTADAFFARGGVNRILVIGAERMSRITDWTDRSTAVIFGDGAGAMVLERGGEGVYHPARLTVTGGGEVIHIPQSHGNSPFWEGDDSKPYTFMDGQNTFKFAVNSICTDVKAVVDEAGLTLDDIDWIIPHQANIRILDFAARRLGVPMEKIATNIETTGNTSSASIPIITDDLWRSGRLKRGQTVVLTAFGGGLASAACVMKW